MNRRKFFKKIGAVTVATIITPHVILAEPIPVAETITGTEGLWEQLRKVNCTPYRNLTRDHIQDAVEYVFKNQPKPERFVRFETGSEGRKNIRETMHAYIINGITYTT